MIRDYGPGRERPAGRQDRRAERQALPARGRLGSRGHAREQHARSTSRDHGDKLYRRSLYTFWKRSAPPASLDIFNAPSREVCTVRRERTNTPLQALVTLNDPQFVEAARGLAQSALEARRRDRRDAASTSSPAGCWPGRSGPRSCRSSRPRSTRLIAYYQSHPDDAAKLLAVGESKADPALDPPTLAAWTMLANELMNLDEVPEQVEWNRGMTGHATRPSTRPRPWIHFKTTSATRPAASSSAAGSNAVGWAALAALLGREGLARRPPQAAGAGAARRPEAGRRRTALRAQGQARHLPAHGRRPAADGPVRLQADDGRVVRQGPARLGPHGPAADDHDLGPEAVSRSPRRSTSSPSTASAACGSASCCPTRPRWSTTCASSAACTPRPSTTSRPSRYMQTGNQITGRPCLGAWVSYGLGSLNENLPTFVVLVAKPTNTEQVQAISARLWSSGYLPGEHAGVSFRSGGDPILYINNPPGVPPQVRRNTLDGLKALERDELPAGRRSRDAHAHPAVRAGLPHAVERARADRHRERARLDLHALRRRGQEARHASPTRRCWPGGWSSAACASCRSTTTTGTRTPTSPAGCPSQCRDVDQPCCGLIQDLKARGLLDETLVIWGGEFGRTIYSQGGLTHENYGRDHHPRCFTMWMAGGGIAAGHDLRRDRRLLLQHRQGPGPHPRLPRHGAAPARLRPPAVHLPLSGARPAPDRRRAGAGGQGIAGVIRQLLTRVRRVKECANLVYGVASVPNDPGLVIALTGLCRGTDTLRTPSVDNDVLARNARCGIRPSGGRRTASRWLTPGSLGIPKRSLRLRREFSALRPPRPRASRTLADRVGDIRQRLLDSLALLTSSLASFGSTNSDTSAELITAGHLRTSWVPLSRIYQGRYTRPSHWPTQRGYGEREG